MLCPIAFQNYSLFLSFLSVLVRGMSWPARGQRMTCRCHFSLSTMLILGIEPRLSDLVASSLIYWAILPICLYSSIFSSSLSLYFLSPFLPLFFPLFFFFWDFTKCAAFWKMVLICNKNTLTCFVIWMPLIFFCLIASAKGSCTILSISDVSMRLDLLPDIILPLIPLLLVL